jgi:hypothetical protein
MKKLAFFCLIGLVLSFSVTAQGDTEMKSRLDIFMNFNRTLNFEKMMDYIYPKVFTIAPREQLVEIFKSTFAGNDKMSVEMDSLRHGTISPLISVDKGSYHLVENSMLIRMKVKQETGGQNGIASSAMLDGLKSQYGEKNVRYDQQSGKYVVTVNTSMVAVKNELSPNWTFLNFEPEHPLAAQLLDEAVISKLKAFKEGQKG